MERYDKTIYDEMSVRQKVSRLSVLQAKCPYGEVSSRRSTLTVKFSYVEVSVRRNFLRQNFVRRKVLRQKITTTKIWQPAHTRGSCREAACTRGLTAHTTECGCIGVIIVSMHVRAVDGIAMLFNFFIRLAIIQLLLFFCPV